MITLLTKQDTILCFVSKGKILKKQERVDCMDDLVALMDKIFTGTNIFACLKAKSDLLLEMGNVENALELFDNIPTVSYNALCSTLIGYKYRVLKCVFPHYMTFSFCEMQGIQ